MLCPIAGSGAGAAAGGQAVSVVFCEDGGTASGG